MIDLACSSFNSAVHGRSIIGRVEKIQITEEEDEEIDLDVLPDDEMQTQIELALVGKLFTNSSFNIEAMKNVLRASWKPIKGMAAFDNHLLLLREISRHEQPKDLSFDSVEFWVRVYNVPFAKRSKNLASTIGNKMGSFLEYNDSNISGWSKFMWIRVRMNVLKPLPRGVTMRIGGEKIWVDFRFERLPGFCLICGRLGHIARECEDFDEDISENELPYVSWLRVSPLRMRPRSSGIDRDHENKLFQDLRGPNNAKKKLQFAHDNPIPFLEDAAKASKEGLHDSMGGKIGRHPAKSSKASGVNCSDTIMQPATEFDEELCRAYEGVFVDSMGRAGGLALLWSYDMRVSLSSYSTHHIDCEVKLPHNNVEWRFTGIYGWPESSVKHLTCRLMEELHMKSDKPWLVGGDIHEVFYNFEKKGGGMKCQKMLDMFRDTCQGINLWDVGYCGYPFTWWNGRKGYDSVEERLDKFLANTEWSTSFPWAKVVHLNEDISDHLAILLNFNLQGSNNFRRNEKKF
ncbi:hypothetical protein RDABS01_025297 [Bienertia sinuspersici]